MSAIIDDPVGTILILRGQRYRLEGHAPHVRRDGIETTLAVWSSRCAECGAPFTTKSTRRLPRWLSRRCAEHAQPGVPVERRKAGAWGPLA